MYSTKGAVHIADMIYMLENDTVPPDADYVSRDSSIHCNIQVNIQCDIQVSIQDNTLCNMIVNIHKTLSLLAHSGNATYHIVEYFCSTFPICLFYCCISTLCKFTNEYGLFTFIQVGKVNEKKR